MTVRFQTVSQLNEFYVDRLTNNCSTPNSFVFLASFLRKPIVLQSKWRCTLYDKGKSKA